MRSEAGHQNHAIFQHLPPLWLNTTWFNKLSIIVNKENHIYAHVNFTFLMFLVFVTEANTKSVGLLAQAIDLYCLTTLAYTWGMYNNTILVEQMRKSAFMKTQ